MPARGAPKGNRHAEKHGLVTLSNAIRRRQKRGRSPIDQRTREGQDAMALQAQLIDEQGGLDNITIPTMVIINKLVFNLYLSGMQRQDVAKALKKRPEWKNTKAIWRIHSYLKPVDDAILDCCKTLGTKRVPPPQKSLEEILSEDSETDRNESVTSDESVTRDDKHNGGSHEPHESKEPGAGAAASRQEAQEGSEEASPQGGEKRQR